MRNKGERSKRVFNEKILPFIYSWCFALCEMHLYSLQTVVRNEMPHFPNQGSRESNAAMSDNFFFFKFRVCFSAGVIKTTPSFHRFSRRIWVVRTAKTRGQVEESWGGMLEYSPEKGLLGDILLGASPKPEWDIYLKQCGCPGNISTLCWWWGFLSPSGIHTEINQQQRTGNSRFAEPSSKLTCSLTPNSRNINLIQLVLMKWQRPHLCRCQPPRTPQRASVAPVRSQRVGGRFLLFCDLKRWGSTEFREWIP